MKKLKMILPDNISLGLSRRHDGADRTKQEIERTKEILYGIYDIYLKYSEKLDYLLEVEWKEKRIEENFGRHIFYNAHKRLRRYRKILKEKHRLMFITLTHFDKNYNQEFSEYAVISAKEIIEDFEIKYLNEKSTSKS